MKKIGYIMLLLLTIGIGIMPVRAIDPDKALGETGEQLNTDDREEAVSTTYKKITCGEMEIPYVAPKITSIIITVLEIATPLLIIAFGSIDLIKAVIAQKEDDIQKGWQTFVKRLLVGSIVFVTFLAVEFVIGIVAPHNENENMWDCVDCFVKGGSACDNLTVNSK